MLFILESIKKILLRERKFIVAALCAGVLFTAAAGLSASRAYSEQVSEDIADELVRFHVRANSDTDEDRELKDFVRESVLSYLRDGLSVSSSKGETCELLYSRLDDVKDYAREIIKEKGYDYEVSAELTREFFPTKVYGDIALPAGEYDALRIDIGEAGGMNWWCVMFPPLCYVDVTRKELPPEEKDMLKSILDEESFSLVTKSADGDLPVKVKFKIVELWQNLTSDRNKTQPLSTSVQKDISTPAASATVPINYSGLLVQKQTPPARENTNPDYIRPVDTQAPSELPPETAQTDNINEDDLMLLASIINGEARGEKYEGQVAVGAVVLNRVAHPSFPDTIREVIYQRGAFDAVRDGQIKLTPSSSCIQAARDALNGVDPTDGAIYYWNPKTATSRWINNLTVTMAIGNHNFGMH